MSTKVDTEIRLQVGDDDMDPEGPKYHVEARDIKSRDPLNINESVKVTFEDIFAEPHSSVFSFDLIWLYSFKIFNVTKVWSYRIITCIFAIPMAFFWGLHFGCLACCTIWCFRPWVKAFGIKMGFLQSIVQIILDCAYKPMFTAVSYIFYNIRVKFSKEPS